MFGETRRRRYDQQERDKTAAEINNDSIPLLQ
jgi:hypothetical protein